MKTRWSMTGCALTLGCALVVGSSYGAEQSAEIVKMETSQNASAIKDLPFEELLKKAEAGDADAQGALGSMYLNGKGVPQSYEKAAKWYRKAVEQGDTAAQFNLIFLYQKCKGVSKDLAEARKWLQKAADQGDEASKKAADQGYEAATEALKALEVKEEE